MRVSMYNNSRWIPFDERYRFPTLSSVNSADVCLCQCSNNPICFITTYSGINQTCSLFFGQIDQEQGELKLLPISRNTQVYNFGNRNYPALQVFRRSHELVYPIWNTTAGGDSVPSLPGTSTGNYWPSEPPESALDNDQTTDYTSYGSCDSINSPSSIMLCGINTGFYLTLSDDLFTLTAFYMRSSSLFIARDPMTITIEGSNPIGVDPARGSSWSLLYNGSSGLELSTSVGALGAIQVLTNPLDSFSSYRLLVTSKRDLSHTVGYSEFAMIGY